MLIDDARHGNVPPCFDLTRILKSSFDPVCSPWVCMGNAVTPHFLGR